MGAHIDILDATNITASQLIHQLSQENPTGISGILHTCKVMGLFDQDGISATSTSTHTQPSNITSAMSHLLLSNSETESKKEEEEKENENAHMP